MYFDLISNSEKRDCRPIFDGGEYATNGIFHTQVLTEIEALEVVREFPYNSTTI